jgi:hypothetical protein
LLFAHQLFV